MVVGAMVVGVVVVGAVVVGAMVVGAVVVGAMVVGAGFGVTMTKVSVASDVKVQSEAPTSHSLADCTP